MLLDVIEIGRAEVWRVMLVIRFVLTLKIAFQTKWKTFLLNFLSRKQSQ